MTDQTGIDAPLHFSKIRLPLATVLAAASLALFEYLISRTPLYKFLAKRFFRTTAVAVLRLDQDIAQIHLLYFIGLLAVIPIAALSVFIVQRLQKKEGFAKPLLRPILYIGWCILIGALFLYSHFVLFSPIIFFHTRLVAYLAWIAFLIVLFYGHQLSNHPRMRIFVSILLFATVGLPLFYLADNYNVTALTNLSPINFNAVFYSVVQAWAGKLALVDYYAQYGYYSIFLEFLPHSLGAFSWCLISLCAASFFALFAGLRRLGVSMPIAVFATLSALYTSSEGFIVYWANVPIRIVFPCLGFLLIAHFGMANSRKTYWAIFLVSAASLLWNLDTGIVLFVAWCGTLSYSHLTQAKSGNDFVRSAVKDAMAGLVSIGAVAGSYALYTFMVRGILPHYEDLFLFQDAFLNQNIAAVPIRLFDGWTLIILVYISGLVYAFTAMRDIKAEAPWQKIIFFLALYGLGSFSYYIMRGIPENIRIVAWPSILIISIYSQMLRRQSRKTTSFLFMLPLLIWSAETLDLSARSINFNGSETGILPVSQQISWLKSLNLEGRDLVALSDNSALFYLYTKANCPLTLPGATELVRKDFLDTVKNYALNNPDPPGFVLLDKHWILINFIYAWSSKLNVLPVIATSPDGQLTLYSTRQNTRPK